MTDPTPLHLLEELQAYLIAQGVVQSIGEPASGVLPGCIMAPRDGAPLPRDGEVATVSLRQTTSAIPQPMGEEAYCDLTVVDVIVRAVTPPAGRMIQRQIRGLIVPQGSIGGRKMWTMNNLLVERSMQWRGESEIPPDQRIDQSNITTYDTVQGLAFYVRRLALDGLPYAP